MVDVKNISILGSGNIGTHFAVMCARKGYRVTVYSSKPSRCSNEMCVYDADTGLEYTGKIAKITNSIKDTIEDCDLVFITHPAYMFKEDADAILPYMKSGLIICVIPGTGGAEFSFSPCIKKGAVLCGLQRVPCVARLMEYGKKVHVEGKRAELNLAAIPSDMSVRISSVISEIVDMPCVALSNYLCVTMTPSNPILHTTRLATMFEDYCKGKIYEKNPLFYGEWTDKSSERLLSCDSEHQKILGALKRMDLSSVKSLVVHYDNSNTPEKMTWKITSIKSLHDLPSPMKKVEGGWIPDFDSRYFTADFPYGLAIIEEFARITEVDVPNMNKTMEWYRTVTGDNSRLELSEFGINSVEDIYRFYT